MSNQILYSGKAYSDSSYSDLFERGLTKDQILAFKKKWAMQCKKDGVDGVWLCIDGSNDDCESEGVELAEKGHAKSKRNVEIVSFTYAVTPGGKPVTFDVYRGGLVDAKEMQAAIEMLSETKESILNAYELKTGLDRAVLSDYMDGECWMNAKKAVELGFADKILFTDESQEMEKLAGGTEAMLFSRRAVTASFLDKLKARMSAKADKPQPMDDNRVSADVLKKRLSLILH